jgi:hypothetical protein
LIGFYISAQFASNPIKALFFKALRAIEQGFQQSYPQFLGTPSKDHEKQQLTRCFKNIYEQEFTECKGACKLMRLTRFLNAKLA